MTTQLRGALDALGVKDFGGYSITAMFEEKLTPAADGDSQFVPTRRDTAPDRDGQFRLELPDPGDRRGAITLKAYGPDGLPAGSTTVPHGGPFEAITLAVSVPAPTGVEPSPDLALGQRLKYSGRAIDREGRGVPRDLLVVIWARARDGEGIAPVSISRTSTGGYFSEHWPSQSFMEAHAILSGGEPIPIPLNDGLLPMRIVLVVPSIPDLLPDQEKDKGCSASDTPPRAPDQADLVANAEAYASDAQRCVDFTIPNRTVDEVMYQAVVRTTQPHLKGSIPTAPPTVPGALVDRLAELAVLRPVVSSPARPVPDIGLGAAQPERSVFGPGGAGAVAIEFSPAPRATGLARLPDVRGGSVTRAARTRAQRFVPGIDLDGRWASSPAGELARFVLEERAAAAEPLQLEASVLAELAREQGELTPLRLLTAEHTSVVRRFRSTVGLLARSIPGRFTLDEQHQIDWDETPDAYQATTIAHGHILTLKQVWRADGYSLGDLLYSLPLAPGQQKLVSMLDWNRSEVTSRRAERTVTEDLIADLSHDRDVSDVIRSSLTESMRGSSHADVESVGGGLGGFIGPLVFGAAGGVSSAGSTASQTSARGVTGQALNQVRDRTLQSASAVRRQRTSVVQTARQGESVRAQTEVVANYNHCHALTIEYFEVLRHLQVSQELAAVQECLFVPFAITPFARSKALRWQEPLRRGLRRRELAPGFDALARVQVDWVGADFPPGRYADERVVHMEGELSVRISLPRPADGDNDEFIDANWTGYQDLLWDTPPHIWERYLGVALPKDRNAIWDTRIAPGIAQRLLETLQVELIGDSGPLAPLSVDPTLIGLFAQDRPLLAGIRVNVPLPAVLRSQISRIRLWLEISNLPPGARMLVDSGTFRYRTDHLSHHLFFNRRIINDLTLGDDVEIATPLDIIEKRNPRDRDRRLSERLLEHLDAHIEHYHRAIWLMMDSNRRFMLLDGFVAPDAGGRSVASVVENRIIGVVGNCLVLPVAPGQKLDTTYVFARSTPEDLRHLYAADPAPPMRISLPTSGVFAEAVLGKCNSCELIDDARFWRWEEAPIPDRPPSIDPLSTGSRRRTPPSLTPGQLPEPLVRLQDVPAAPDPTGLTAALAALGANDIFPNLTGVALNQENAAEALKASISAAQGFASKAGALAQQRFLNKELDRSLDHIKAARANKLISAEEAQTLTESALRGAIGEPRPGTTSPTKSASVQRAIDRVATSNSGSLRVTRPEGTVEVKTGSIAGRPSLAVTVDPPVVPIKQKSNLVCWAAGGAMMESWRVRQSMTVEAVLDGLGGRWRQKYDQNQGLSVVELRAFLAALNMTEEPPQSYTPEGLARLLEHSGPLYEIGDDGIEANQIAHVRIITAIKGDGTPDGTTVTLEDPASGTTVVETFRIFDLRHSGSDPAALLVGIFHL